MNSIMPKITQDDIDYLISRFRAQQGLCEYIDKAELLAMIFESFNGSEFEQQQLEHVANSIIQSFRFEEALDDDNFTALRIAIEAGANVNIASGFLFKRVLYKIGLDGAEKTEAYLASYSEIADQMLAAGLILNDPENDFCRYFETTISSPPNGSLMPRATQYLILNGGNINAMRYSHDNGGLYTSHLYEAVAAAAACYRQMDHNLHTKEPYNKAREIIRMLLANDADPSLYCGIVPYALRASLLGGDIPTALDLVIYGADISLIADLIRQNHENPEGRRSTDDEDLRTIGKNPQQPVELDDEDIYELMMLAFTRNFPFWERGYSYGGFRQLAEMEEPEATIPSDKELLRQMAKLVRDPKGYVLLELFKEAGAHITDGTLNNIKFIATRATQNPDDGFSAVEKLQKLLETQFGAATEATGGRIKATFETGSEQMTEFNELVIMSQMKGKG